MDHQRSSILMIHHEHIRSKIASKMHETGSEWILPRASSFVALFSLSPSWIADAGLTVKYRLDTQPKHGRSQDKSDPLYTARSSEIISLWCLQSV